MRVFQCLVSIALLVTSCSSGRPSTIEVPLDVESAPADITVLDLTVTDEVLSLDVWADQQGEIWDLFVDVDPWAPEAVVYASCKIGADCESGFCIQTPDGKRCTMPCLEECPLDWQCVLHEPSLPDEVYLCALPWVSLCRPCAVNADCMTNGLNAGQACVSYGGDGSFCAAECAADEDCPVGYVCEESEEAGGATSLQCVLDEGECQCNQWFVDDGAATTCYVENEWGTCTGQRVCTAEGLSPCDAFEPGVEECNKLDDDCDGVVDEDTAGADCLNQNQFGTCPGISLCVDGNPLCDGPEAKAEQCDGEDNNCNGQIDEGFEDTDKDGIADCMENDKDGDGIADGPDNCPEEFNPGQLDTDFDNFGDACDADDDNDQVPDTLDCAPLDKAINPDAEEICDGKDNNCNFIVDEGFPDTDSDGWHDCVDEDDDNDGSLDGDDCAPMNPLVYPGQAETCDALDNDCNGNVDDGLGTVACGKGACAHEEEACVDGKVAMCDPTAGAVIEFCDGLDNDCDGLVDEDLGWKSCGLGVCAQVVPFCQDGDEVDCDPLEGAGPEVCDGLDNDCDGKLDQGLPTLVCGQGACFHVLASCVGGVEQECDPFAGTQPESCDGIDNDCDGKVDEETGFVTCGLGECQHDAAACEDGKPTSCNPFQGVSVEVCDGLDNDCNGLVDNGLGTTSCGLGLCLKTVANCVDGEPQECNPFAGAEPEICDGIDNDCDGKTDEGLGTTTCGLGQCEKTVANCANGAPQECDATAGWQVESCDGLDNNCDGNVDDGLGTTSCGLGQCEKTVANCIDGVPQVCNPLGGMEEESCNGIDNNCNGEIDDGLGVTTCGLGQCEKSVANCEDGAPQECDPMAGWEGEVCDGLDNDCDGDVDEDFDVDEDGTTTCGGDCNDEEKDIYPGAQEVCNGVDDNCNDVVDESFPDTDNDGDVDCFDDDDDGDGLKDVWDGWPLDPAKVEGPLGGTGRDGNEVVNGTLHVDEHRYGLASSAEAGAESVQLSGVGDALLEGDELLVWKEQKVGAGVHQFIYVTSVVPGSPATVAFVPPLAFGVDPAESEILVQRVKHYESLLVKSGGTVTAQPFVPGSPGGAVVLRCKTACIVEAGGTVSAPGLGFAGGPGVAGNGSSPYQGNSYNGPGKPGVTSANGGGGGAYPTRGDHGDSGGGGGYGTAGSAGTDYFGPEVCDGGDVYGDSALSKWHLGSGGGAGSPDAEGDGSSGANITGAGGKGGGLVALFAGETIDLSGSVSSAGNDGGTAVAGTGGEVGGGGAGSGGTIYLAAPTVVVVQDNVLAPGGIGGKSNSDGSSPYGSAIGGNGGNGRIRLDYQTLNGAAYPDGDETLTKPATGHEGTLL